LTVDLPQSQIDAFYVAADQATLNALAGPLLGNATMRVLYDIHVFANSQAASPNDTTKWQPTFPAPITPATRSIDSSSPVAASNWTSTAPRRLRPRRLPITICPERGF
jgi:hypothetical protein